MCQEGVYACESNELWYRHRYSNIQALDKETEMESHKTIPPIET